MAMLNDLYDSVDRAYIANKKRKELEARKEEEVRKQRQAEAKKSNNDTDGLLFK